MRLRFLIAETLCSQLTHQQLQRGRGLTLRGAFQQEFRMAQRCMTTHDFREGVRSILIDKDNAPTWNPSTLSAVTPEYIEQFFEPLGTYDLQLPV